MPWKSMPLSLTGLKFSRRYTKFFFECSTKMLYRRITQAVCDFTDFFLILGELIFGQHQPGIGDVSKNCCAKHFLEPAFELILIDAGDPCEFV